MAERIVRNQLSDEKVNSWDSMIQQQFIEKLNYVIRFNANLFNFTTSGENGQKINIPKS